MPFFGLLSFLLINHCDIIEFYYGGVNTLHRASFISTAGMKNRYVKICLVSMPCIGLLSFLQLMKLFQAKFLLCVNALHQASFISTKYWRGSRNNREYVSMPFFGLLLFLQTLFHCSNIYQILCQCPLSGFLSVLQTLCPLYGDKRNRVNALHRDSFIFCSIRSTFLPHIFSILLFYSSEKPFLKILFPTTQRAAGNIFSFVLI